MKSVVKASVHRRALADIKWLRAELVILAKVHGQLQENFFKLYEELKALRGGKR